MKSSPHVVLCSFCNRTITDVAYLFQSSFGATPACICDRCIEERMACLDMNREAPGFLMGVIALQRAKIAERWAESHPAARLPL